MAAGSGVAVNTVSAVRKWREMKAGDHLTFSFVFTLGFKQDGRAQVQVDPTSTVKSFYKHYHRHALSSISVYILKSVKLK